MMKTKVTQIAAVALLGLSVAAGTAMAQQRVFFGIATGGTGGTYYPLGGMLAQVISNNAELRGARISATAETGNASVANAGLLGREAIESAFVAADILGAAYNGENQFEDKAQKNLRALGALYPETVQLVAQPDIQSVEDLAGQSVSSGSPGSGQYQLLTDLLDVHGLSRDDIDEDYSSFSQAAGKIADGNLGASLITAGTPTSSITELANSHDVNIVPLAGPEVDALLERQPQYTSVEMPAETYRGVDEPVQTLAVRAIWATHAGVSDEMAYNVTKALYDNVETLAQVHVKGREISLETALESVTIPLHPGAERFYREQGVID